MNKKQLYPEIMRTIAIIAVITQHVCSGAMNRSQILTKDWQILQIIHIFVQWCVPLFLMVTGIFLLNPAKPISIKKIYTTYIPRMLTALVVIIPAYEIIIGITCENRSVFEVQLWKEAFLALLLSKGWKTYWYLYMLIGLYIYLPVYRAIVKSMDKQTFSYTLIALFMGACALPMSQYINREWALAIYAFVKKTQIQTIFTYGFFLLLGYYLTQYEFSKKVRYAIYVSGFFSLLTAVYLSRKYTFAANSYIETWSSDHSPLQYIAVTAIFIFIKHFAEKINQEGAISKIFFFTGKLSFGVYLIHPMVLRILRENGFSAMMGNPFWTVPLCILTCYTICICIAYLLRRIPWVKSWL